MSTSAPVTQSIAPSPDAATDGGNDKFHWTPGTICLSLFLFLVAGLLEIGGGWLVWQTIRWVERHWQVKMIGTLRPRAYAA